MFTLNMLMRNNQLVIKNTLPLKVCICRRRLNDIKIIQAYKTQCSTTNLTENLDIPTSQRFRTKNTV